MARVYRNPKGKGWYAEWDEPTPPGTTLKRGMRRRQKLRPHKAMAEDFLSIKKEELVKKEHQRMRGLANPDP
jgi:hypothetical protein